ncbi:hypothetical protein TVNIR_2385 [Thioalkalivibrio nitratireducens DSM 14787]|uniref:Uncharacterized protein n=1 Tax=Thioalkalivibrio nitratireducens (strain DSM 14787 / UNIQEM 213 / ALEN2) TaxID=1255043 RepID=L0DYA8_THIND|nr:hypothetical protein [Thioalkalivibrio nitratireducens]AGA34028.1 hypothetical protein TVNIR_2385 [Thioalkalivibrio nitratireducens DSM 14787]
MSGHFPFAGERGTRYGLAPRGTLAAFFENHGFNDELQEKYYRWWYDYANDFVANDPDLSATVGVRFHFYPMGTHARHSFHLNGKFWAVNMEELGSFISNLILPKLDADTLHGLEAKHRALLDTLREEAKTNPREAPPDVGLFRHV